MPGPRTWCGRRRRRRRSRWWRHRRSAAPSRHRSVRHARARPPGWSAALTRRSERSSGTWATTRCTDCAAVARSGRACRQQERISSKRPSQSRSSQRCVAVRRDVLGPGFEAGPGFGIVIGRELHAHGAEGVVEAEILPVCRRSGLRSCPASGAVRATSASSRTVHTLAWSRSSSSCPGWRRRRRPGPCRRTRRPHRATRPGEAGCSLSRRRGSGLVRSPSRRRSAPPSRTRVEVAPSSRNVSRRAASPKQEDEPPLGGRLTP